ncbi:MAG: hypothetical protein B6245_11410 [Desulfobacteraceae bacterium 4572_88]|nr:MAG: hypothetical protein B6245_11410 [Desulfobacteraceae bacterium 4572_88]
MQAESLSELMEKSVELASNDYDLKNDGGRCIGSRQRTNPARRERQNFGTDRCTGQHLAIF